MNRLLPVLCLLALSGCAGAVDSTVTKPLAAANDTVLKASLTSAAAAQEAYSAEASTYATSVEQLQAKGLVLSSGVQLTVTRADAAGYCLKATNGANTLYLGLTGGASVTDCTG